ncbi:LuxR C-terminal-related transcriptional regulator [Acaryochloris marina]|uniref:Transcriptional regulator, LuxR family with TPR repeats n=1 Tax=Acaryochloris marina (strain MBIC 11017) TaxID=329726 RepID=B0C3T0_ACAM1|nr:LuxR C-terminal-related transcriptional regulator [Acaryochloris marina]ABW31017.1 transcriptional regulator, LuxR family with TPR repeats [Acaryochloris marina MBIC11017]
MPTPILATKLYIPLPRPEVVSRARLIDYLQGGLNRKFILVSAPAGFGKSTLVSDWVSNYADEPSSSDNCTVTWLSLDEEDNDLQRFLSYVIAALRKISSNFGESVLAALQSPQPLSTENILTVLLNEITTIPEQFVLVLDDYHRVDNSIVDQALTFLIEHLPPQAHLVIATREDPAFPLARWRVQGQLCEVRVKDLRFNTAEAVEFLNQRIGLNLSRDDITALENRTEGWVAGLQLAALSIQGQTDPTRFIQTFTGSHHFVLDYLVAEVLQCQSEPIRHFLLQSSILQRLTGPLCNAVTEQTNGQEILKTLERDNLFVVPLDDQRQWYRYHHLFAEVLQAKAIEEQPEQISGLHSQASGWYERQGLPTDAIYHAFAAQNYERAANLVELNWRDLTRQYQNATVIGWMKALPDELFCNRPVLNAGYAWALMGCGKLEAAEPHLQAIEQWLDDISNQPGSSQPEMVVVNEAEFHALPVTLAAARAYQAQTLGDIPDTLKYAQQALDLLPEDDYIKRAAPTSLLGIAHWANGDLDAAHRFFTEVVKSFQRAGDVLNTIDLGYALAEIRATQGYLREALKTYQKFSKIAIEKGGTVLRGTANLYMGISELQCEWNDLDAAAQSFQTGKALDETATLPDWQHRWRIAQARMKEAQGDLNGALDLLNEAERLYYRSPMPTAQPIAAQRARVWVRQGRLMEAWGWVRSQNLSIDDDLSYLREFEHMTLVRILITQYRQNPAEKPPIHGAVGLLDRLLTAAEAGGRIGSAIALLILQALAQEAQGNIPVALVPLQQALTLAEPEGYIRLFLDEGPPMMTLLQAAAKQDMAPSYVLQLLGAFRDVQVKVPVTQGLAEPLSDRELDVLKLLRTELSGPEIARELMVSLNTMRTHTKNIYSKLGVNNRRSAVKRAAELELL